MLETQNDPRELVYREHHVSGKLKVYSWEPERKPQPPPSVEYRIDFASGKTVKVVREIESEPEPPKASPVETPTDARESPQVKRKKAAEPFCLWHECKAPLSGGKGQRFCSAHCRRAFQDFRRKELRYYKRVVSTVSEHDEQLVASVVDRESYLRALQVAAEAKTPYVENTMFGLREIDAEGPWEIVACFREEMRKGLQPGHGEPGSLNRKARNPKQNYYDSLGSLTIHFVDGSRVEEDVEKPILV